MAAGARRASPGDPGAALREFREFRRLYAAGRFFDAPEGYLGVDLSGCRAAHPELAAAFARWEAGGARPELRAPPIG